MWKIWENWVFFSMKKRLLWNYLIAAFRYIRAYKKSGEGLFTRACRDRTKGNGFTLQESRFRVNSRKKSLYWEGSEALGQAAQKGGQWPVLEMFRTDWKELWATWPWQGDRNCMIFKVPSNPDHSVIVRMKWKELCCSAGVFYRMLLT